MSFDNEAYERRIRETQGPVPALCIIPRTEFLWRRAIKRRLWKRCIALAQEVWFDTAPIPAPEALDRLTLLAGAAWSRRVWEMARLFDRGAPLEVLERANLDLLTSLIVRPAGSKPR